MKEYCIIIAFMLWRSEIKFYLCDDGARQTDRAEAVRDKRT